MATRKPSSNQTNQSGLQIGGNVNIKNGDFVGGDKHVNDRSVHVGGDVNGAIISGDGNTISQQIALREEMFEHVLKKIDQRPNTTPEDKDDLKVNVEEVEAEAEKGENADETFLARRLRNIGRMAPDILEVVTASLVNPAAGFALIVKKVAEQAKKGPDAAATGA